MICVNPKSTKVRIEINKENVWAKLIVIDVLLLTIVKCLTVKKEIKIKIKTQNP
jgi:hypothetical protein